MNESEAIPKRAIKSFLNFIVNDIMIPSLILLIVYVIIVMLFHSPGKSRPVIVSHRGAAGLAPENTITGIQKAIESQADCAEVDIRRTNDGVIILFHDETVNRITDKSGKIDSLSLNEIKKLDVGSYFGGMFQNTPIPTIDEVFSKINTTSFCLVIELKNPKVYPNIEQELINLVNKKATPQNITIVSFNFSSLLKIKQLSTDVSIGLLTFYPINLPQIKDHQIISVFWPVIILDPTLIYRLHNKGYQVWVWTVNNPFLMKTLTRIGIDGITTDRPDVAANLFKE